MNFAEHIKVREEKFGAVIFETLKEKVFVTNKTGKDILRLLQEGKSLDEVAKILTESYDASEENIKEDVNNFISQLKDNNLLK